MRKPRRHRLENAINAGSMADIAFLLLIFFLVSTKIMEDQGIIVRLPPWEEEVVNDVKLKNVFQVYVNSGNELLVESKETNPKELKGLAKEFIMNPYKKPNLPSSPKKAVISIKNDRGTAYETYLEVYNELQAAYNELWEERAQQRYNRAYEELSPAYKKEIRKEIPLIISEAEPSEHGE